MNITPIKILLYTLILLFLSTVYLKSMAQTDTNSFPFPSYGGGNTDNNEPQKTSKNKKENNSEKSVLKKTDFELYGSEPENNTNPNVNNSEPTQKSPTTEKNNKKKNLNKKNQTSSQSNTNNSDVVDINLDVIYNFNIDTVFVREKRADNLSFKAKEDIKYFYNQALLKVRAKDFSAANTYLSKCLKQDKYNKELLQMRANTFAELEKYSSAIKDYKKAIKVDSDDPVLHYNLGAVYMKVGKIKEAIKTLDDAINLRPNYTLALQARASAKAVDGNFEGSVNDYNRVLDENAFFIPALKGRGVAKSMLNRYDEAISDFSAIIEQQALDGLAYYYRGLAYFGNNEPYRGCADLDKSYQLGIQQAYFDIKELCR